MSIWTVLGAFGCLHGLFLLALVVTSRLDLETRPTVFAGPPTHVRVLYDDPRDLRRAGTPEQMTYVSEPDAPLVA